MTAARLPRGRHRLTREQVAAAQRERMLRAIAETMAERGYVATSVADVLRAAGVSRETFYQQFASKADGFMHAFEAAAERVLAEATAASRAPGPPLTRLDRALRSYLDALAREPAFARLFLLEVYAAGPPALARRAEVQRRFADAITTALDARDADADAIAAALDDDAVRNGARHADRRFACEALVAATSTLVGTRLAANDLDGLRALHGPLLRLAARMLGEA